MSALSDIAMKKSSKRTSLEESVLYAPDAIIQEAAAELAALREDKLKLEIAARDFLRAVATRSQLLPSEYREAHDTLAAMVKKGDE